MEQQSVSESIPIAFELGAKQARNLKSQKARAWQGFACDHATQQAHVRARGIATAAVPVESLPDHSGTRAASAPTCDSTKRRCCEGTKYTADRSPTPLYAVSPSMMVLQPPPPRGTLTMRLGFFSWAT